MSMEITITPEHRWLHRLLGDWTWRTDAAAMPGAHEASVHEGTERMRLIGDAWVIGEGDGGVPGGDPATNVMTLGYDPGKQRFVGTFVASMMTHLWVYEGELDASGNALVLHTTGPSFAGDGTMAPYRDTITFVSDDERTLTSDVQQPDGSWTRFMTSRYRRDPGQNDQ